MKIIAILLIAMLSFSTIQAQEKITVSTDDLTKLLSEAVQKEINLVRQNPERYRKIILESGRLDSSRYQVKTDKIFFIEEQGKSFSSKISTHEGISVYQEADSFLLHQKKLEPYIYEKGLREEAKKQCEYLMQLKRLTHDRPGGKEMNYLDKLDGDIKLIGENLGKLYFGILPGEYTKQKLAEEVEDVAQEIMLGWIIDDGIWNRGHREVLFYWIHKYFGAYCLVNKSGVVICAVEFSNQPFKK